MFVEPQVSISKSEQTPAQEVMTVREVASVLRCSKAHVHNLIAGRVRGMNPLPAIHLGRRSLVR